MYLPEETVRIPAEGLPFMATVLYSEGILTVHLVPRGTMTSRTKDLPSALKDERIFPDTVGTVMSHSEMTGYGLTSNSFHPGCKGLSPQIFSEMTVSIPPLQA